MSPTPPVRALSSRRRLLAAGVVVAAAAGMFALWPRSLPGDAVLLSLAVGGTGDSAADASRMAIALARGRETPRLLAASLWSAKAPSLSYDGRHMVFAGRRQASGPGALFTMRIDGAGLREVTAGNGDPADPAWLPDGRIIYGDAAARGMAEAAGARALFACAADGSAVTRLTWGGQRDARPEVLLDGRVRFERRAAAGQEAAIVRMVVHPDGTGLAALPEGSAVPMAPIMGPGMIPGGRPPRRLDPPQGYTILATQTAATRPRPPVLTSVVNASKTTGTLLCLDAYASRLPEIAALARGVIDRVRVETVPPAAGASADDAPAAAAAPAVLGEAPVHADGSFFIEVPADTPLRLALLARDGSILARFDSGVWVRPNENRGCIGCHEASDRVPENRRPQAVDDPPVRLPSTLAMHGGRHGSR